MSDFPDTRFTTVREDRVAYQVVGDGPVDLLYTGGRTSFRASSSVRATDSKSAGCTSSRACPASGRCMPSVQVIGEIGGHDRDSAHPD